MYKRQSLTRPERVKVLILDDSVITRNRSKAVELLARVYDHVTHKYQKGCLLYTSAVVVEQLVIGSDLGIYLVHVLLHDRGQSIIVGVAGLSCLCLLYTSRCV